MVILHPFFSLHYFKTVYNSMELNFPRNISLREIGDKRWGFGHIQVTRLQSFQEFCNFRQQPDTPSYASQFCAQAGSDHLVLAYEDGSVAFRRDVFEEAQLVTYEQIHKNAIFDVCWVPGEHQVLTASGDETSILLDIASGTPRIVREFRGHIASVRRVAACPNSPSQFATGGRDGKIITWDTRSPKIDDIIAGAHRSNMVYIQSSSVMDLKYIDPHKLISCGNADNSIKIWDLRKTHSICKKPLSCFTLQNPKRNKVFLDLVTDLTGSRFYASSSCNKIYRYKFYVDSPEGSYEGAICNSSFIRTCLSPDGEYLLSGSVDNNAYIWSTKHNLSQSIPPLVKLTGHTEAVTAVSWATTSNKEPLIVTCSDDNREMIWAMDYDNVDRMKLNKIGTGETLNYPISKLKGHESKIKFPPDGIPQVLKSALEECTPDKKFPMEERLTPFCINTPPQLQTPPECRKLFVEDEEIIVSSSKPAPFLQNLPNFIVDGVSPRNVVSPMQVPLKENIDWLTQMRNSSGSEEKARLQKSSGKKHQSVSNSGKKRKGKSLLQYFPKIPKEDSGSLNYPEEPACSI